MDIDKPWWVPDTRAILAVFLVTSVVAITFLVILHPPASDNQLAQVLVGALVTTGLAAIIGFYFGSSSSSKDKDDTISSMVIKQPAPDKPLPIGSMPTDIKTENTTVTSENTTVIDTEKK
jgi:hypothetical protein